MFSDIEPEEENKEDDFLELDYDVLPLKSSTKSKKYITNEISCLIYDSLYKSCYSNKK